MIEFKNISVTYPGGVKALDNVTLNISHTWDGDLEINLVSPSGVSLDLSSNNGGSSNNYTDTVCLFHR